MAAAFRSKVLDVAPRHERAAALARATRANESTERLSAVAGRRTRLPASDVLERRIARPRVTTHGALTPGRAARLHVVDATASVERVSLTSTMTAPTTSLVWRKSQSASQAPASNPHASTTHSVSSALSTTTASLTAATQRGAAPSTSVATALTGAALERLTDDVMRRIERRVRLERERRGL